MPYADYQRHLDENRKRQKTPQGAANHARANQAYRERNRLKARAHNRINQAISRGKLRPWPVCAMPECADANVHGHHADYSEPLSVTWLCDEHHKAVHRLVKELI